MRLLITRATWFPGYDKRSTGYMILPQQGAFPAPGWSYVVYLGRPFSTACLTRNLGMSTATFLRQLGAYFVYEFYLHIVSIPWSKYRTVFSFVIGISESHAYLSGICIGSRKYSGFTSIIEFMFKDFYFITYQEFSG